MSLFDNLSKKVGDAAQAAAKKSGELVEVTKLNMSIKSEEEKVQQILLKVGKAAYEKFKEQPELFQMFEQDFLQIISHEQTINQLKEKITTIKNPNE